MAAKKKSRSPKSQGTPQSNPGTPGSVRNPSYSPASQVYRRNPHPLGGAKLPDVKKIKSPTNTYGQVRHSYFNDSQQQFDLASEETKEALFNREEAFPAWEAATGGYDNASPEMLGVNTGGMDSTRITYAQYFFNPDTDTGNMYVSFRGTVKRSNGNEYVYTNVPVYAARRFYNALSKGKDINAAIGGLEVYGYAPAPGDSHFGVHEPTPYGEDALSGMTRLSARKYQVEEGD